MKITIYELIGLVKDGKAPEKIRYNNEIWKYDDELKTYDNDDYGSDLLEKLFYEVCISDFINNEVEIIEEPKKIEKLLLDMNSINKGNMTADYENYTVGNIAEHNFGVIYKKINELIDKINNLKEK